MRRHRGRSRTGTGRSCSRAQVPNKLLNRTHPSLLKSSGSAQWPQQAAREHAPSPSAHQVARGATCLHPPRPRGLAIAPGGAAAHCSYPGPVDRWPGRQPLTWRQVLAPRQLSCSLVALLGPCVPPASPLTGVAGRRGQGCFCSSVALGKAIPPPDRQGAEGETEAQGAWGCWIPPCPLLGRPTVSACPPSVSLTSQPVHCLMKDHFPPLQDDLSPGLSTRCIRPCLKVVIEQAWWRTPVTQHLGAEARGQPGLHK